MISVKEAIKLVLKHSHSLLEKETLTIDRCLNRNLASSVKAPINLPTFRQSSMDGYALCIGESSIYKIIDEVKAGDNKNPILKPGECVRIFTGAIVPDTASAVIMQEKVVLKGDKIKIETLVKQKQNIRGVGSQIKKGDNVFQKGQILQPSGLALLKSLGINEIDTIRSPKVIIVLTGDELISPSETLSRGKVYESNSLLLQSALDQQGIETQLIFFAEDTLDSTISVLKKALLNSDVVLISGGISVGEYDFVKQALIKLKVQEIFYKVKQKPGKPLYFGKKKKTFVFALPGNPASTLCCFYIYVLPLLCRLKGGRGGGLISLSIPIAHNYVSNENRALFLKANIHKKNISVLDRQNSSMLISFAKANALVYIPEKVNKLKKGDYVETFILPTSILT